MSLAKLAVACGLIAVALGVSACGIKAKPVAGTVHLDRVPGNHSFVSDPRTPYLGCLHSNHFTFREFQYGPQHLRAIQVGTVPTGPTIVFEPTPGVAEGDQMKGEITGAEVIGQALVYPNRTPDAEMKTIEGCISIGVQG